MVGPVLLVPSAVPVCTSLPAFISVLMIGAHHILKALDFEQADFFFSFLEKAFSEQSSYSTCIIHKPGLFSADINEDPSYDLSQQVIYSSVQKI